MPELADPGAACAEEAGNVPAPVSDGVVQWGADRILPGLFNVGAAADQCVGYVGVVAAGRPVQGRLGLRSLRVTTALGSAPAPMSSRTVAGPAEK